MVDLFPFHAMATPSDPLSHQLHQQQALHSSHKNPNLNPWGTWEELLLASAVLRHGSDNWALVSAELQPRARACFSFTPEACRAGYQAIKLRFGSDVGGEGNGAPLYEELRRLRVAHLKWELEQYDNSIGSLESKIKRLQSEKEECARDKTLIPESHAREPAKQSSEPSPIHESAVTTTQKPILDQVQGRTFIDGTVQPSCSLMSLHPVDGVDITVSNGRGGWSRQRDDVIEAQVMPNHMGKSQGDRLESSNRMSKSGMSKSGIRDEKVVTFDMNESRQVFSRGNMVSVKAEEDLHGSASNAMEVLVRSHDAVDSRHVESNSCRVAHMIDDNDLEVRTRTGILPVACREGLAKKRVKDEDCRKSEESDSLCYSQLKALPIKRKRSSDGSGPVSGKATYLQGVDDKRLVCKALGERRFLEAKGSRPVESADSTEGKGHGRKGKIEMPDPGKLSAGCSKRTGVDSLSLYPDDKNHSNSSTDNSLLHEVWGESAEVGDDEVKRVNKKRRLRVLDRRRKSTTFDVTDPEGSLPESTAKLESITTSHEASESMHSPGVKEENDEDTEAWHQAERLSGDSRFEKSEVGSYVDGNEDISPMSRRNRREPKVSGKLIPLLESLRTVCAHRCAHLFRHNQETEENQVYHQLIRVPLDLGMIRTKLEEGHYAESIHFFRDLLLMVSNAFVYYPRDSFESAAALGLRESIMKEMGHVFETEALVKQEGPSFRKRDSRKLALGNQERRKGLKVRAVVEKPSRDIALKQSDISTTVDIGSHHQNLASPVVEGGGRTEKEVAVKRTVDVPEGKKMLEYHTTSKGSKLCQTVTRVEARELSFRKISMLKDPRIKAKNVQEKKGKLAKVGTSSEMPAIPAVFNKGVESGICKPDAPSETVQEPVKRKVGRPPKHSQQQGFQKAKVEVPNLTVRKRARK